MDPHPLIRTLGLVPLPGEGGWFRETWRSKVPLQVSSSQLQGRPHRAGTAIYYFLGPGEKSRLHRIPSDEIYHFYQGGTVNLLILEPSGSGRLAKLGNRLDRGEEPQILVPGGSWQGSWVEGDPNWALMGTTVVPGFEFEEWEAGHRETLLSQFSHFSESIQFLFL